VDVQVLEIFGFGEQRDVSLTDGEGAFGRPRSGPELRSEGRRFLVGELAHRGDVPATDDHHPDTGTSMACATRHLPSSKMRSRETNPSGARAFWRQE
jgi:hypothetical protein